MKSYLLLTVILSLIVGRVSAQHPTPGQYALAATVDVRSLPSDPYMTMVTNIEAPDYMSNPDKKFLFEQKAKNALLYPRKPSATHEKGGNLPPPQISKGFMGNQFGSSVPLDNYLSVSNHDKLVSVSNTIINMYDVAADTVLKIISLQNFSQPLGLAGLNNFKYDPKTLYDPIADRFIIVYLNGSLSNYSKIVIGFSQTNDPSGTWNLYTLPGNPFNDTTWLDYPGVAITQNELFITGNQIRDNVSWQQGFRQTVIWQIRKSDGYNGVPITTLLWDNINYNGQQIRNLHAVKGGSGIYGPNQYFMSNRNFDIANDTLFLIEIPDTIGTFGMNLNMDVIISDKQYGVSPDALQTGTTKKLATNDGRILSAFIENDQIQFASNSIDTSNGRPAIYFGTIDNVSSGNYVVNTHFISSDTLDLGYPNISWVGNGSQGSQSIIAFDHSSDNTFAGVSAIFYADNDFSPIITVKQGDGILDVISGPIERWGDYFGSQPVYNRDGRVWICGTYGNNFKRHTTWIARLDNPYGFETFISDQPSTQVQMNIFPNPAAEITSLKFTLPAAMDITIDLYDLSGKKIDVIYKGGAKKGTNLLSFQIHTLPAGTYVIQINGSGFSESLRFIKS